MRALLLFLFTVAIFFMAQGTGNPVLFHLFYLLAALLLVCYLWAQLNRSGLTAWRELRTTRAQVGKEIEERLVVHNRSRWPKLWVEVEDRHDFPGHVSRFVTSVPPGERRRLWTRTICRLRGKYTFGPIWMSTGDPLGLFLLRQRLDTTTEVVVYPATEPIYGFYLAPAELPGGTATRRRTHQITPNVSEVREYAPGDSYNRIHWRSTARHQRLMVKEFELDPTADVWIVLDLERSVQRSEAWRGAPPPDIGQEVRTSESTEEYLVTAAASLGGHFILQQRRNTGLIAWGQYREVIPPEREPRQFFRFLESLAILRAHGTTPLAEVLAAEGSRFSRHTSLIVLTCSTDPQWVRIGLRDLLYRGVHAVAVLVDGATFGGWQQLEAVQAELLAQHVPFYILRKGEPIGQTLSGAVGEVWPLGGARVVGERYAVL
ncbi:MAG: DUF58 domain-containing protein [Chloroflexia bacterium]